MIENTDKLQSLISISNYDFDFLIWGWIGQKTEQKIELKLSCCIEILGCQKVQDSTLTSIGKEDVKLSIVMKIQCR